MEANSVAERWSCSVMTGARTLMVRRLTKLIRVARKMRPAIHQRRPGRCCMLLRLTAPVLGLHIGDGLRKCPAVAFEVQRGILTLSEGVCGGRLQDPRFPLFGVLVVPVDIVHGNHERD